MQIILQIANDHCHVNHDAVKLPSMRSIRTYLPTDDRKEKPVLIQARISRTMKDDLKRIAYVNRWKASDVIRGVLQKFIDDERELACETGKTTEQSDPRHTGFLK